MKLKMIRLLTFVAVGLMIGLMVSCHRKPSNSPSERQTSDNPDAPAPDSTVVGYHEDWGPEAIVGWAWDSARPDEKITVDIIVDGKLLASPTAEKFRQDLKEAGKGDGKHGVVFDVPESLRDGLPHSVRLAVSGTRQTLLESPKTLTYPKAK